MVWFWSIIYCIHDFYSRKLGTENSFESEVDKLSKRNILIIRKGDTLNVDLEKFKVEEIPLMKLESSLWHQFTKDEKLGQSVQGFRTATVDGKKINIPHLGFSADLDYLDDVINRIVKKARQLKIED